MAQLLAALGVVLHRRDQHVDLALLQELHAVGRLHLHRFQLHIELPGQVLRQVRVEADGLLRGGIDRAKGAAGQHDADHDLATLADLVERGVGLRGAGKEGTGQHGGSEDERTRGAQRKSAGHGVFEFLLAKSWFV